MWEDEMSQGLRWVTRPAVDAHVSPAERQKRAQLRAWLQTEKRTPLTDVQLAPQEKRAIAIKVCTGKRTQSLFPRGAGSWRGED